jgi:hypothetical protein
MCNAFSFNECAVVCFDVLYERQERLELEIQIKYNHFLILLFKA